MVKGVPSDHADRYLLNNAMLKESSSRLPVLRINEHNNPDLIIALERTEAKETPTGVGKNKKDERNSNFPQQHAPHLTDAFDAPIDTMYMDTFKGNNLFASESSIRSL